MALHILHAAKRCIPAGLVSISLLFSSCYNYRIATHAQAGTETQQTVNASSFFWGLAQSPKTITTPICDSLDVNGMAEVTTKSNFGYSLITVVTLGIWSPMKIVYKCGKPCKKTDTL